jgi:hypothetical protein
MGPSCGFAACADFLVVSLSSLKKAMVSGAGTAWLEAPRGGGIAPLRPICVLLDHAVELLDMAEFI